MKNNFWDLLAQSVITQSVLTIGVVGVWLFMMATSQAIPPGLTEVVMIVVGFFFGGKYALAMNSASVARAQAEASKKPEPPC